MMHWLQHNSYIETKPTHYATARQLWQNFAGMQAFFNGFPECDFLNAVRKYPSLRTASEVSWSQLDGSLSPTRVFKDCILIGDKSYRSNPWRLTHFEYAGIELSVPCRSNELLQYTMPDDYARIISKVTLFTLLQFVNSQISRSLNHIRYTLAAWL